MFRTVPKLLAAKSSKPGLGKDYEIGDRKACEKCGISFTFAFYLKSGFCIVVYYCNILRAPTLGAYILVREEK